MSQSARTGQAAAAWRARPSFVYYALLKQAPVLAGFLGLPGLAAAADHQRLLAVTLLAPTFLLVLLSMATRRLKVPGDLRRIEAVATLTAVYLVATLMLVPAFMALELNWIDALFESTSGTTTTGLSVARDAESWPISAHFLRAWAQWSGGLAIGVGGVAFLMDAGRTARIMGKESLGGRDYLASTRTKARVILSSYAAVTAFGIMFSIPLFPTWWEGPVIVLAAVSTGGFTPRASSLADYGLAAQVYASAFSLSGAITLMFFALAATRGPRFALRQGTASTMAVFTGFGLLLYLVLNGSLNGWSVSAVVEGTLTFISAQTTTGFSVEKVAVASPLLLLLVVAMIIGGEVGSTAGGIKIDRALMLFRMVSLIFLRLRLPDRAVSHLKIGGRQADAEAILFSAALLSVYLSALSVFWLVLAASGHPASAALFDAVSALSTVGLSAGVIGPDLSPGLKLMACIAMLLGRLEFFAVIILLLPSTWIPRR